MFQKRSGINGEQGRTAPLFSCQRKVEKSCLGFKKNVEWEQRNKGGCKVEKHVFANCVVDRAGVI